MKTVELINSAIEKYQQKDFDSAFKIVEKILKQDKKNADALVIKGNVYFQKHQIEDSLQCYLQAIESDSQNKSALINAANTYLEIKNYEQAYTLSKQILKIDFNDKIALSIWGNSALELEKYNEGKEAFLRVLQLDSSDVWSYNSLSRIYQKTADLSRAIAYAWKAVELSGGAMDQHLNFGYLLYEIEDAQAKDLIKKYALDWVKKYGQNPIVKHMGNALIHKEKITRADASYVREIFDVFADDFETVLASLNYRAPQFIAEEFNRIFQEKKTENLKVLDAGCGTGLCGELLKKAAPQTSLYGVDISEKMLEKATQKKCYDDLIKADLESYFSSSEKQFDIIVSSDVLTYFGDLKNLISGFAKNLKKNGQIIFTVSANKVNHSDYYLHPSGRFLHHQKYIKKLLKKAGLKIEKMSENVLRLEGDQPVDGYVFTAVKKA